MRVLLFFLIGLPLLSSAQSEADECTGAIEISNATNYCSASGEFSTVGTNPTAGDCFTRNDGDMWFSFTSVSNSVNIRVLGAVEDEFGLGAWTRGTMEEPRIILFEGSCEDPQLIACQDQSRRNIAELFLDSLTAGNRYFLKVAGRRNGSFQLCISSFDLTPEPQNDCVNAVVLCSKQSFYAPYLSGGGSNPDELDNSCLDRYNDRDDPLGPFPNDSETATAWYKWIIRNTGDLTFTITPNNPSDDIDFALLRLPGGINDCNIDGAEIVRCMASGANSTTTVFGSQLDPLEEWIDCYGPTGLRIGDPDPFEEVAGCQDGNNNFVMSVDVIQGEAYILVVDNFSNSEHGFSIDFGGTAEFIAPEADFMISDTVVCLGQNIQLTNTSTGVTEDISWNFGTDANLGMLDLVQNPEVFYRSPGTKTISLIAEGNTGCLITERRQIEVLDPISIDSMIQPQTCSELDNGFIELSVSEGQSPISEVTWDNGGAGLRIEDLPAGRYEAYVTNTEMCTDTFTFTVPVADTFTVETMVTQSTCTLDNGVIEVQVDGDTGPFQYDFGNGFSVNNRQENLAPAIYEIVVQDVGGCTDTLSIPISDQDLEIETNSESVSCFGDSDGFASITILAANNPVEFNWNMTGFGDQSSIINVDVGTVSVEILDAQGCRRFAWIEIEEPDSLDLQIDTSDISCFGFDDGSISLAVTGGTGDYNYRWSNGGNTSILGSLSEGEYQVTITDENMCTKIAAGFVTEPEAIGVAIGEVVNVMCFGDASGIINVVPAGGSPPYEFSIDGLTYQSDAFFDQLTAGDYQLSLRDVNGCIDTISQIVTEPEETIVVAENDTTIRLGFTAPLTSSVTPNQMISYQWFPPELVECPTCEETVATPFENTAFVLEVLNEMGCLIYDTVEVNVILDRPVFIPNAITPDGDGNNDRVAVFAGPAAIGLERIQIFDRWGELVYESNDLQLNDAQSGWDGTLRGQPLNPGVFVYLAEILFLDNQRLTFAGDITLIR